LYLVPSHCRIPPNFPFTLCTGWERLRKVRKQEGFWDSAGHAGDTQYFGHGACPIPHGNGAARDCRGRLCTGWAKPFLNVSVTIYDGSLIANTTYVEEFIAPMSSNAWRSWSRRSYALVSRRWSQPSNSPMYAV
jgi:hypothetical protein